MRTLTKLSLVVALALTLSSSAGAVLSMGLVQVGGTYSASFGAQAGDTLVLDITYSLDPGDVVTLIDPGILFDGMVQSFNAAGSTETPAALMQGYASFAPIATGDIALTGTNVANGWEKASVGGVTAPCAYGPGGSCTSMGTAAFVISGSWGGVISVGGHGLPGGTLITDGTYADITPISNLGEFWIMGMVPEPTTGSLLGLGLVGLAAIGRRRRPAR